MADTHVEDPAPPAECDALERDLGAAAPGGWVAVTAGVGTQQKPIPDDARVPAAGTSSVP